MRPRIALSCGLLLWGSATAAPPIAAGGAPYSRDGASRTEDTSGAASAGRRLTGRFLHITDFHPDPYYKTYSSTAQDAACHREHGPAGIYGAETSGCDSPFSLINQTFRWINDNLKDSVDFVIWTGDSARHDNDEDLPRTEKQVIQQNEFLVSKFAEVFGNTDHHDQPTHDFRIPIVPTFGNNDIMPHNIFLSGPNRWTTRYLSIWRNFIPEAQRHQFQQGGWFSVEVIPGKLAVISLNTMYFFSSNSGVDGCANKHEPGYEHMEWLRIQLQLLRQRGLKTFIMGHVAPARVDGKESWDETCWQKYTLWMQQFRDVVVGSLYGHMNIDHFMLQDFENVEKDTRRGRMASEESQAAVEALSLLDDGEVTVASASDYLVHLREAWARLPTPPAKSNKKGDSKDVDDEDEEEGWSWRWLLSKMSTLGKDGDAGKSEKRKYLDKIGGKFAERYAVTLVAPSVVPNYFPTLRIFEYNITGLEDLQVSNHTSSAHSSSPMAQHPLTDDMFYDDEEYLQDTATTSKKIYKKKPKKGPRKYKFKVPQSPDPAAPPGPAYSPQALTLTRYIQYFANLTHINNDFVEPSTLESHPSIPEPSNTNTNNNDNDNDNEPNANPISTNTHLPAFLFGTATTAVDLQRWKEGKHHKHQGKRPKPEPHPNPFIFEVEYDTQKDKGFAHDLTVRRWVEYAERIGEGVTRQRDVDAESEDDELWKEGGTGEVEVESGGKGKKKKKKKKKKHASRAWYTFVKRAFVSTMDPRDIEELAGAVAAAERQEEKKENAEL